MAHHDHRFLKAKQELRAPMVEATVISLGRLLTNPRGVAAEAIRQINVLKETRPEEFESAINSFNIPKEDLLKIITAYETLLNTTEDLC